MGKIFRKILCLTLVCILFLHINYIACYFALYTINVNSLTDNYCEKKVESCNGQCYLNKKIDEESEDNGQKEQPSDIKLKLSEYEVIEFVAFPLSEVINKYYSYNHFILANYFCYEIEHPPRS